MSDEEEEIIEDLSMEIIANAGKARSLAQEALNAAKKGDFPTADKKMEGADQALNVAHGFHSKLLKEGSKDGVNETVLMAHAQDHVMGIMDLDVYKELIGLYKAMKDMK